MQSNIRRDLIKQRCDLLAKLCVVVIYIEHERCQAQVKGPIQKIPELYEALVIQVSGAEDHCHTSRQPVPIYSKLQELLVKTVNHDGNPECIHRQSIFAMTPVF